MKTLGLAVGARHRVLWFLVVVACSSGDRTPQLPTSQQSPAAPAQSAAIIELKVLTVLFEGIPIARLHADGRTESVKDGKPGPDAKFFPGPTLHSDGTIELTKRGFKARVKPDGDIVIIPPEAGQPEQPFARMSGDRILFAGSRDSGILLEGSTLALFDDSKTTVGLGVVEPPSMRRTALLMAAAFYMELAIRE